MSIMLNFVLIINDIDISLSISVSMNTVNKNNQTTSTIFSGLHKIRMKLKDAVKYLKG